MWIVQNEAFTKEKHPLVVPVGIAMTQFSWFNLGIQSHHFVANRWGNSGNSDRLFLVGGAPKSLQMVTAAMKLKDAYFLEGKLWPKEQRHYFANIGPLVKAMVFLWSCMDVRIGLWRKLSKNWCVWSVMLEKTLESPLDCKKIQPVHP